jgi:hypothetical protein
MPMSLSAAEIDCDTASKRKMALVDVTAERGAATNLEPGGHGFSPRNRLRKPLSRNSV